MLCLQVQIVVAKQPFAVYRVLLRRDTFVFPFPFRPTYTDPIRRFPRRRVKGRGEIRPSPIASALVFIERLDLPIPAPRARPMRAAQRAVAVGLGRAQPIRRSDTAEPRPAAVRKALGWRAARRLARPAAVARTLAGEAGAAHSREPEPLALAGRPALRIQAAAAAHSRVGAGEGEAHRPPPQEAVRADRPLAQPALPARSHRSPSRDFRSPRLLCDASEPAEAPMARAAIAGLPAAPRIRHPPE